jgi:hypothetical protein
MKVALDLETSLGTVFEADGSEFDWAASIGAPTNAFTRLS